MSQENVEIVGDISDGFAHAVALRFRADASV